MQQLARRMFKSVSTMTRVVAQLVRRGYVKRRPDPGDGRVVQVAITPQGLAIVAAIRRDLRESQKAILAGIPEPEWPGAFKVLEALADGARCWQERCCRG
jgi:DNA-binding MarR family transcriptional regulator